MIQYPDRKTWDVVDREMEMGGKKQTINVFISRKNVEKHVKLLCDSHKFKWRKYVPTCKDSENGQYVLIKMSIGCLKTDVAKPTCPEQLDGYLTVNVFYETQRASSSKKREISALEKSDSSSGPSKEFFINNHGSSSQFERDSNTSATFVDLDADCGMDELLLGLDPLDDVKGDSHFMGARAFEDSFKRTKKRRCESEGEKFERKLCLSVCGVVW